MPSLYYYFIPFYSFIPFGSLTSRYYDLEEMGDLLTYVIPLEGPIGMKTIQFQLTAQLGMNSQMLRLCLIFIVQNIQSINHLCAVTQILSDSVKPCSTKASFIQCSKMMKWLLHSEINSKSFIYLVLIMKDIQVTHNIVSYIAAV